MKKTDSSTTPPWVNIEPDPYVVQRMLEVLAAQHGVAVDGAVREALNGTKTPDDRKEQLALAAGGDAYKAYWKALKVIVAELTADIDTSDVEAQVKKEGSK